MTFLPRAETVPVDFYLARVAPTLAPTAVAATLREGPIAGTFGAATALPPTERGLTALNLVGLSGIESLGASLAAALGVAILGAFVILERRREFAILHTVGADSRQILTGPALEGAVAAIGSVAIGLPVGLGLGVMAVRVLGLFFTLAPPLLTVPVAELSVLVLFMIGTSTIALAAALAAVNRVRAAAVLREP
jgi:putative ABC transport system permease protein